MDFSGELSFWCVYVCVCVCVMGEGWWQFGLAKLWGVFWGGEREREKEREREGERDSLRQRGGQTKTTESRGCSPASCRLQGRVSAETICCIRPRSLDKHVSLSVDMALEKTHTEWGLCARHQTRCMGKQYSPSLSLARHYSHIIKISEWRPKTTYNLL